MKIDEVEKTNITKYFKVRQHVRVRDDLEEHWRYGIVICGGEKPQVKLHDTNEAFSWKYCENVRCKKHPINGTIVSIEQLLKHLKLEKYGKPFMKSSYNNIQHILDMHSENESIFREMVNQINSILQEGNYTVGRTFKIGHLKRLKRWIQAQRDLSLRMGCSCRQQNLYRNQNIITGY